MLDLNKIYNMDCVEGILRDCTKTCCRICRAMLPVGISIIRSNLYEQHQIDTRRLFKNP